MPSSTSPSPWPARFVRMLVALFLSITASALHSPVSVLLVQQLARQSVWVHHHAALARQGDSAAEALGIRWNTTIWVLSALASAVVIPLYSSRALHWGRRRLLLLGLGSMVVCEAVYAIVASQSGVCEGDGCRPDVLFGVLAGCAALSGILGGDQLVVLVARMITIDESTEETRAEQINYLQAAALAGYVTGPILASLLAASGKGPHAVLSPRLFFAAMAIYLLAAVYVLVFVKDRPMSLQVYDEQQQAGQTEETRNSGRTIDRYLAVALFEPSQDEGPGALAPLRRLPIVKILVCSLFAFDGSSVMSYMLLFADARFDWTARENGRLLGLSALARLLVIVFLVPRSLRAAAALLRTSGSRATADADALHATADERQPLLGAAPSSSKYQHAEPWVALVSFVMSMLGWLAVALSAVLISEELLVGAILVLALGIGGNSTLQAYAVNLLEAGQRPRFEVPTAGTAALPGTHAAAKTGERAALDVYLGILGMLENLMSVLAPLLDGALYAATFNSAPYLVFLWAALQYALCASLLLWL